MKKILFIINPISGASRKANLEQFISLHIDKEKFYPEFVYTQYAKHAKEISKQASTEKDIVVAIGGDGTVNEVAEGLANTKCSLAIIPTGSGNGLARFLKIPLDLKGAVETINNDNSLLIDTGSVNGERFVNVAGVGFDAYVSHKFAHFGKRGFLSYLKIIAKEFLSYKSLPYRIIIDKKEYRTTAFSVSFANSSQFGNNAHIAPYAKIDDGVLEVCILSEYPKIISPILGARLFLKNIHHSDYMRIIRGKQISLIRKGKIYAHLDGEAFIFENELKIKLLPKNLRVIVGSKF